MIDSSSPNQPVQNYEIVNPGLETQVAALLPSVAGYGGNLRATNTIIPIVDLTAAAEGSNVPESMQQAIAFGSQTAFSAQNATVVVANTPGFYRIFGVASIRNVNGADQTSSFTMSDGISVKTVWQLYSDQGTSGVVALQFDFICFLAAGESISAVASSVDQRIAGSSRQIATLDGTLVTPSGF